jgi:hypothetical protein
MAGYIGNDPAKSSVRIARQKYTSSASQTDFTFTAGYDPGYLEVYVNGVRQTEGTNFTANDGASFQILNGIGAGNTVTAAAYKSFNLASVSLSEVTDVDNLTITGQIAAATGDIGIATITGSGIDIGVGIITGNGSGLTGLANTDFINAEQLNVIGVTTTGIGTITTSVVVGNAVTVTGTAITVDPAVTATFSGDVNFQGGSYNITRSRANSSIDFDDSAKARFGTGDDLSIYHDSNNSIISNATGSLLIDGDVVILRSTTGGESYVYGSVGAGVTLFWDNSEKLRTKTDGVTITGECEATSFAGDGSALSGVGGENDITSCLFI